MDFRRLTNIGGDVSHPAPSKGIAIDLGTATGLIWSDGSLGQITVKDPLKNCETKVSHIRTIVARNRKSGEAPSRWWERDQSKSDRIQEPDNFEEDVVAVGQEAYDRLGRAPDLNFSRAVKRGNISDVSAYRAVLRYMLRMKDNKFDVSFEKERTPPRILIGLPRNATAHHLKTVESVIERDIKAQPFPVWEQIAAAVGAKLANGKKIPFENAKSCIIADIGGGTLDFAVLSKGDVVEQRSYETAGDDMDDAIIEYMAQKPHRLDIGVRTAIAIKERLGSALPQTDDKEKHLVFGASFETQQPGQTYISRAEIRDCLKANRQGIVACFLNFLESLQRHGEVHADILDQGIYLTGGASMLAGLDQFLQKETGLKIIQVENPTTTVIDGLVQMLDNKELLQLGLAKIEKATA